ncbi:MAG: PEP-CTERM sorting domain-containing protein, partial [Verrucomicrobiales bacterium]
MKSTYPATVLVAIGIALGGGALAGPFPPAAPFGSDAVAHDSSGILFWADGYSDFQQGPEGYAFDNPLDGIGAPSGNDPVNDVYDVVSLGQGGQITLTFPQAIANGDGPDFAVFENAFNNTFLELAYVELSQDGISFVRFPSTSLTTEPVPYWGGSLDASDLDGLAGKYLVGYGTPFDLADVDLAYATHLRLVDIVGDGNALDTQGNPIY